MPTIKDTEAILDYIANDPMNPKSQAAQQKMGLSDRHIEAWKKAKENPNDELVPKVKTAIFDTIADALPVDESGQGVLDLGDRVKIKNLIDERPDLQEKYLQSRGFETKRDPQDKNRVVARKKGEIQFGAIDPKGFDAFDFFDVIEEVAGGVVGAVTTGAKALGLVGAPATGGVSLAAASALGAASEAGLETARQQIGKSLGLREEFDKSLIAQRGLIGAALPGIGKVAEKAVKGVSSGVAKRLPQLKPDAKEIKEAAKALKIKTTPGMLYDSQFVQNLESQLSKESGMIGGFGLRQTIKKNIKATREFAEDLVQDASGLTSFESGALGKKQIAEAIENKLKPAEIIYNRAEDIFSKKVYKPNIQSVKDSIAEFAEEFKFNEKAIQGLKDNYEKLLNAKNLTDIKRLRTTVNNAAKVALRSGDSETAKALSGFSKALTKVRSDTLKELIDSNKPIAEIAGLGKEAIERADRIYAGVAREVEETLASRGQTIKGGVKSFSKNQLDKIKETQAINKILDVSDPKKIAAVRKNFPEAFETLRQGKIEEVATRSLTNGEISPKKLVKALDKMPKETRALLLGNDADKKLDAMKVVIRSIPENINPSGTSFSLMLDNMFSLLQQTKSIGKSALLDAARFSATASRALEGFAKSSATPGIIRGATQIGLQSALPKPDSTQRQANPILPNIPNLGGR